MSSISGFGSSGALPPRGPIESALHLPALQDGFGFVDLRITKAEAKALDHFVVETDNFYDCYADVELGPLASFLQTVGKGDAAAIAALIKRVTGEVIKASGKETAWLSVRATTENDLFDQPPPLLFRPAG